MAWILKHILIPEGGLRTAALVRVCVSLLVMTLTFVACRQGWGGGSMTFGITFLNALILLIFSAWALRWPSERGLWMMYAFLTALSLLMYALAARIPLGAPAPSATPRHTAAVNSDAALGAWICLMNIRLQVSAAVANFRRFLAHAVDAASHRPP